jgi:hypothetical protein
MNNEPLDLEKIERLVPGYSIELAALVLSKPKDKETHAACVAAMADVLVLISCKMCGYEQAQEIVPMAIAHGFKMAADLKTQGLIHE